MKGEHTCDLAEKSGRRTAWPCKGMFRSRRKTVIRGCSLDRAGTQLERGLEAPEGNVLILSTTETIGGF